MVIAFESICVLVVADLSSLQGINHAILDWDLAVWKARHRDDLHVLVVLRSSSDRTCVVVQKGFIQGLQGHQSCFEVSCVQTPLLALRLLCYDENMVLSGRELVENESMTLRQVLFNAYASFKWLQKDITLPESKHLHLGLLRLKLA